LLVSACGIMLHHVKNTTHLTGGDIPDED